MTQAGVYGQRLGRRLRVNDAPALITRSLRSADLAVTETRNDAPEPGLSGAMPEDDAYLVSLKFRDYADCECWENDRCVIKTDVYAGATYLYDLKRNPRYVIDKPFHSIFFYLPRSAASPSSPARRASASSPTSPASAMTMRSFAISADRLWNRCAGRRRPTSSSPTT